MDLPVSTDPPRTMWVDMNSSFARTEQQAHPRLRGVPVGVAKYTGPSGPVISPSVEAKRHGIRTAHSVARCRERCPEIRILRSDPEKYREMHRRMLGVFSRWSPVLRAASIDECGISFAGSPWLREMSMEGIAREIKRDIRAACGEWITVSVGIGGNQFLAKVAAGLVKPDGLVTIDHRNLREILGGLRLTDLPGIDKRYAARLALAGITTPLGFLDAPSDFLRKSVFRSVEGWYWHLRLRGYEHQAWGEPARRTFGRSHSILAQTAERAPNVAILTDLCADASRLMRAYDLSCRTVAITLDYADARAGFGYDDGIPLEGGGRARSFYDLSTGARGLHTTGEVAAVASALFDRQPAPRVLHRIGVVLSNLQPDLHLQSDLFETGFARRRRLMAAVDAANDRWGKRAIYLAAAHGAGGRIDDSISFGSTGDVQRLYEEEAMAWPSSLCPARVQT